MRAFIAIELERDVREYLALAQAEAQKYCRRGNFTPVDNLHLTLHFLGETGEDDLEYLRDAMYEAALRNRPFCLTLGRLGFFPRGNRGILWAGLDRSQPLQRLFSTLEKALEQQGFAREKKGLSPHITLGREVEPQRGFADVQKAVSVEPRTIEVRQISLMESVRKGPKLVYEPLFRQELSGKRKP